MGDTGAADTQTRTDCFAGPAETVRLLVSSQTHTVSAMIDFRKVFSMPRTSSYTGALGVRGICECGLTQTGPHSTNTTSPLMRFTPARRARRRTPPLEMLPPLPAFAPVRFALVPLPFAIFAGGSVGMAM